MPRLIPVTMKSPLVSYMPFPRFLMEEPFFSLSAEAKLLYVLMLDRAGISRESNYLEPDGRVKIYFTVDEIQARLHKGRQRTITVIRELENSGLIIRRKRGQGRPAVITMNYPDSAKPIAKEPA